MLHIAGYNKKYAQSDVKNDSLFTSLVNKSLQTLTLSALAWGSLKLRDRFW